MTFRQSMLSTALFAALVATGAQAQVRTEQANSPFTYDALGATPSLQLNFKKRTDAAAAAYRSPATATPSSQFTYDAVGATPQIKRPEAMAVPSVAAKAPATAKDVR